MVYRVEDFKSKYKLGIAKEGEDFFTCNTYGFCKECVEGIKPCHCTCRDCDNSRPNGVCLLTLSTEKKICDKFVYSTRRKKCKCGWWSCGSRGCGDCPDCYGEHCECHLMEPYEQIDDDC